MKRKTDPIFLEKKNAFINGRIKEKLVIVKKKKNNLSTGIFSGTDVRGDDDDRGEFVCMNRFIVSNTDDVADRSAVRWQQSVLPVSSEKHETHSACSVEHALK